MEYVSCGPTRSYRTGGFFEGDALLRELLTRESKFHSVGVIEEIFPPFAYQRRPPATLIAESASFLQEILGHYRAINRTYSHGAACELVEIENAALSHNVMYALSPEGDRIVYESYRRCERPYVSLTTDLHSTTPDKFTEFMSNGEIYFLLGSAGAANYGHWLVEDLPRLKAAEVLWRERGKPIAILFPSHSPAMDSVCQDSIRQFLQERGPYSSRPIHPGHLYRFDHLYYASPISYHPVLKSPDALRFLVHRTLNLEDDPTRRRGRGKLFVLRRKERGRRLLNIDAICSVVQSYGFTVLDPEDHSYIEQLRTFADAGLVVGTMGAAMVNTVFCAPESDIVYLAPEGWLEPFFWDLAEVLGHNYHVCFGPVPEGKGEPAHRSDFVIFENRLRAVLDRIIGAKGGH